MAKSEKPVEERIREHYTAQNGEWLVEKGKVREAKLLKEACLKLEQQSKRLAVLNDEKHRGVWANFTKEKELNEREKMISEREERFEERKSSFIRNFKEWV